MRKTHFLLVLVCILCPSLALSLAYAQESILTPANPIKIDAKKRSVSILAEVNAKHPARTHHGIVFKGGKYYRRAIFIGLVDPKTLHDSLMAMGFKPGNNMTRDNMEKTYVEGEPLEVTVTWKGAKRPYRLDEVIRDSNGRPLAVRFGGNLANAVRMGTGCLLCLDSCPVGITSNATYTYGAIDKRRDVVFTADTALLPPGGTLVVITFIAK